MERAGGTDEVADLFAEVGRLLEPGPGGGKVAGGCRRPGPGLEQVGPDDWHYRNGEGVERGEGRGRLFRPTGYGQRRGPALRQGARHRGPGLWTSRPRAAERKPRPRHAIRARRGIHPAILSKAGLGPALKTLARRSALPVELELRYQRRLPEHVEVAAYYVVSEALTNAAMHAHASAVKIDVVEQDAILKLAIRDDGVGGADPSQGTGLAGLADRIEALGGRLEIASPARSGTWLSIEIPVEGQSATTFPDLRVNRSAVRVLVSVRSCRDDNRREVIAAEEVRDGPGGAAGWPAPRWRSARGPAACGKRQGRN